LTALWMGTIVFISFASLLYPFLFIASKNIFSEGYIQFPLSLTPLSFSLFAGLAPASWLTGEARGIVEISRSTPRDFGASDRGAGVENLEKSPFGDRAGGVWSIVLESQLFPWLAKLASLVAPGKAAVLEGFDLSHAARVAGSTGQTSAGVSVSFAIWLLDQNASRRFDDASMHELFGPLNE